MNTEVQRKYVWIDIRGYCDKWDSTKSWEMGKFAFMYFQGYAITKVLYLLDIKTQKYF
jgi:hypothetical protein